MSSMAPGGNGLSGPRLNGGQAHASGTSTLLERRNIATVRRSTPDSEALVSSDDDHDQGQNMSMSTHSVRSLPPARRSSFLVDVRTNQRRTSLGGASVLSMGSGSQPTTPSGDPSGPSPWTTNIWSTRERTAGPSRMAEMLASPTASVSTVDDLRSPALRDQPSGSTLPFEFPLEPSRKTVRSQSYSAGQLERGPGSENGPPFGFSRSRTGITTRSSRPSMRGGGDGLASLQEDVNDEEDSSNGSDQGVRLGNRNDGASEFSTALPPPLSEDSPWTHQQATPSSSQFGGFRNRRAGHLPTSPDSDYAIEEHDEIADSMSDRGRSMVHTITSGTSPSTTTAPALLNQRLEDVRRMQPQWTSRLGFDVPGQPESRRHSFAVVPRERNGSTGQLPEPHYSLQHEGINGGPVALASHMNGRDGHQREAATEDPAYFSGAENHRRHLRESTEDFNPFAVPSVYSRPGRVLYIVSFKCKRADIFYIPDNTGLSVKAGDTVIVEGDRGQDLGTVEHSNVTMDQAKKYKEEYTKQHFKCLMMFSRFYPHVAALANNDELFNETIGRHAGSPGGVFEPEPRPKMIKRVAKPDEVHLLREKEGNEAKAKRMCQNKVSEHNLRMEILDAEFQHDYRKLTFFYYAEEYINFNDLVTDLFKVYKTRIWMSAINPASYTVMNPNNAIRPHNPPRQGQGQPTNYAAYLRAQDEYSRAAEQGQSPHPDYLASRMGDLSVNGSSHHSRVGGGSDGVVSPASAGAPAGPPAYSDAFHSQLQPPPRYDPRRAADPGSQYSPFAPQYGASPWGPPAFQPGIPVGYPTQEAGSNYSTLPVSPAITQPSGFMPRSGLTPLQYPRPGGPFAQTGEALMDAPFSRYPIDPRRT